MVFLADFLVVLNVLRKKWLGGVRGIFKVTDITKGQYIKYINEHSNILFFYKMVISHGYFKQIIL